MTIKEEDTLDERLADLARQRHERDKRVHLTETILIICVVVVIIAKLIGIVGVINPGHWLVGWIF